MKFYSVFVVFWLGLALAACSTVSESALRGTSWKLTELAGLPVLTDSTPTLLFEDEHVGGNTSCNSFSGTYQMSAEKLTFGELASTMMACLEPSVMEQESAYLAALSRSATFQLDDEALRLYNSTGQLLATFTLMVGE